MVKNQFIYCFRGVQVYRFLFYILYDNLLKNYEMADWIKKEGAKLRQKLRKKNNFECLHGLAKVDR